MKLAWLPLALANRDAQLDYIAQHNPMAAVDMGDRIEHQVGQLLLQPELGRPGRVKGTRELVISRTPLIVVYRVRPKTACIELARLLHASQRWPAESKAAPAAPVPESSGFVEAQAVIERAKKARKG